MPSRIWRASNDHGKIHRRAWSECRGNPPAASRRQAKTRKNIYDFAFDKWGWQSPVSLPLQMVRGCTAALKDARLIEVHCESDEEDSESITYTVAPHLDELQAALGKRVFHAKRGTNN